MTVHPIHLIGDDGPALIEAWQAYRKGVLPDPGGFLQQPARLVDAFQVMDAAATTLLKARKGWRGR